MLFALPAQSAWVVVVVVCQLRRLLCPLSSPALGCCCCVSAVLFVLPVRQLGCALCCCACGALCCLHGVRQYADHRVQVRANII